MLGTPPPVSLATPAARRCAACESRLAGAYCHVCGERAVRPDDESMVAFLREQFHEVTSADGRLWRTLRALPVPGMLTTEYFAGRRGLYVRPVRVFLVVNILFFLLLGVTGGQAFRGGAALYRNSPALAERLDLAAAAEDVRPEVYDAAFGARTDTLSTTLIAVLVPLFAVLLAILLLPARPPLVRHVVFATHAVAVFMAAMIAIGGSLLALSYATRTLWGWTLFDNFDPILVPTFVIVWVAYLVVGVRRVYGVPWWGAGLAGLVLGTVGTVAVMYMYQAVLFFVALQTLDVPA